jgi:hypothetical protein
MSNNKMVEVEEGLQEGELVVINPRSLMSDKEKAAAGAPGKGEGAPGEGQGLPGGGEKKGPRGMGPGMGQGMSPGMGAPGMGGPAMGPAGESERKGMRMKKGPGGPPTGPAEGQ